MEIDDQDDLRRFLQDRCPRVSSVRECEVGWMLLCSIIMTTGGETLALMSAVTGLQANTNQTLTLCYVCRLCRYCVYIIEHFC